ncbi:hypothetical protein Cha6605_0590 [Chamaesiphon minutus PCC 6605]|uniref:Uncharacterized protein n=1 Tax=Chamaesiphon minutus (strain ATCC 27169 / PCC 6605) TaxID=1173020 RepID=K9UCD5_CHAP6|nr:hypothetical protein Cha6605_0590 [Chamaesiphon minutus PCC 6605]
MTSIEYPRDLIGYGQGTGLVKRDGYIERETRYWSGAQAGIKNAKLSNHNEAQNAALRRRASAYRRRQNLYAKLVEGLQRVLDVQRLIHNWVKPHWGLGKCFTPAMAMGYRIAHFRSSNY